MVYGNVCAFCNLQLKLIEAAHIVPVRIDNSTDKTSNGVALCALHHKSYDYALVTFNHRFEIRYDETKMDKLKKIGHDGGMRQFINNLRPAIIVPPEQRDRPNIDYVKRANRIRGWKF